jgi:hypothetical protein
MPVCWNRCVRAKIYLWGPPWLLKQWYVDSGKHVSGGANAKVPETNFLLGVSIQRAVCCFDKFYRQGLKPHVPGIVFMRLSTKWLKPQRAETTHAGNSCSCGM